MEFKLKIKPQGGREAVKGTLCLHRRQREMQTLKKFDEDEA